MISADCVRTNALGVGSHIFGYEEIKTAALLRQVDMMVYPASIGQGYTRRTEGRRHHCPMDCRQVEVSSLSFLDSKHFL